MSEYQLLTHEFEPVYDENSRILILGSFPSVKSREMQFYYGHPRNRFWNILSAVYGAPLPGSVQEKTSFLLTNGIALWDVIAQCEIRGSSDASIRCAEPTDLRIILDRAPIKKICCNGNTAFQLFNRYQRVICGREAVRLPSSSPANAAWSLDRLIEAWREEMDLI